MHEAKMTMLRRGRFLKGAVFGLLILGIFSAVVHAQGSPAISQGFVTTEKSIPEGALVSLETNNKDHVQLANSERVSELAGVAASKSLIEIDETKKNVKVVTSGVTNALVSNINGGISSGDKITASPINGVGMKANGGTQIVGIAQGDLSAVKTVNRQIKDRSGEVETVKVGTIPLQVNVSYYPEPEKKESTIIPEFLQQLANTVAGREVPILRIIFALFVLLLGFVSIGIMLYASVRSSIISIGRNPLSESAVQKSLFGVASVALVVLLVMLSAVYLILTV